MHYLAFSNLKNESSAFWKQNKKNEASKTLFNSKRLIRFFFHFLFKNRIYIIKYVSNTFFTCTYVFFDWSGVLFVLRNRQYFSKWYSYNNLITNWCLKKIHSLKILGHQITFVWLLLPNRTIWGNKFITVLL
jgi:hypothetical protein